MRAFVRSDPLQRVLAQTRCSGSLRTGQLRSCTGWLMKPTEAIPAEELLAGLAAHADAADAGPDWPEASWNLLRDHGVLGWAVPAEFGGNGLSRADFLIACAQLAGACLTTTFILSQRDAAVRRLAAHAPTPVQRAWLPRLARDEVFATVGLSQLTTSRRHRPSPLVARPAGADTYRLDGEIPWVTGADRADAVVTGAALEDGRQALFLLPMNQPGVAVGPPLALAALTGSQTALIHC